MKNNKTINTPLKGREIVDVVVEGIDTRDYPDFCDAYIESAVCIDNGMERDCTDFELDILNENRDFVYEETLKQLY